jgi:hypothetical protein
MSALSHVYLVIPMQSSHGAASISGGGTISALASEAAYVLASSATILFNKHCLR